ncbi:carbamoyltransferase C-terminal domain-containing protein [Candidatus Magnetominusculus dajiuhuensis]|uniref:carbamoyltransferase C-terminal domain-containing protein n=1 Tax=Candidatus Magnetominusculus dajiuhuensis TaxID=3137712 RepID=UPI003B42E79C
MRILGIWDGHDAGAAVVGDGGIEFAINEERLSRRKLDVGFPILSIEACLDYLKLDTGDIDYVSSSTTDFAKTLTRALPSLKEQYYRIRRRKVEQGKFSAIKKKAKYLLTEIATSRATLLASNLLLKRNLIAMGFRRDIALLHFDHHFCHATAAAFCSGFDRCLVLTLDGIGDGLSGSVSVFEDGRLNRIAAISGRDSFGIFFEHVTNLLNMRELEDEGKVMALADYAYPVSDDDNPLMDFFRVSGIGVHATYGSLDMYEKLKKVLWRYPSEQFAFMAQRTLEVKVIELIRNALKVTGCDKVALSGGVFSNIKVNMLVDELEEVGGCFIFPHMGDGGLALGAAMAANYKLNNISSYDLKDVFFGPQFSNSDIVDALDRNGLKYTKYETTDDLIHETARLIADGQIVFWFQEAMEYGPRALGNRSIIAAANSDDIKNHLNMRLKMRVWYQPFCPSILQEDLHYFTELSPASSYDRYMTRGYRVRPGVTSEIRGVISLAGTCRPQVVSEGDGLFYKLLVEVKKLLGRGVVLNTSFNLHGDPLVCAPEDAARTFIATKNEYMAIGSYMVQRASGQ